MDREELIQEIVNLGHKLGQHVRRQQPDAWMNLNLTISQVKSLFFINATGGTNFRKLAAALGRTPPDVTRIVDRLVGQGLVSRRENPEDRRMLMLHTTEAGKALVTRLHESRMNQMQHILEQLSDKELATLVEGLSAVARVLSNQTGENTEEP